MLSTRPLVAACAAALTLALPSWFSTSTESLAGVATSKAFASASQEREAQSSEQAPITVVVVRHAEKAAGGSDPELTQEGAERAAALARTLGHAGVTHVFASEFKRTQLTVAPLAAATGLEVQVVSAREPDAQREAIEALPGGSVVVVAGHSNTVPGLVAALGGEIEELEQHERYGPMLGDDQYDRLFVVTASESSDGARVVSTLELRYGE